MDAGRIRRHECTHRNTHMSEEKREDVMAIEAAVLPLMQPAKCPLLSALRTQTKHRAKSEMCHKQTSDLIDHLVSAQ
jgi:hypothetical protein